MRAPAEGAESNAHKKPCEINAVRKLARALRITAVHASVNIVAVLNAVRVFHATMRGPVRLGGRPVVRER